MWACGASGELGHGLTLEVVVAVGPDRCGLAVCVVLVSFPKTSRARPCLVPELGTYPPAPERPALGAFEKCPMVEDINILYCIGKVLNMGEKGQVRFHAAR